MSNRLVSSSFSKGTAAPPNQIHPSNLNLQPMGNRTQTVEESSGRKICQEL